MAARARTNGGVLQWARRKAGLSLEEAAARAKIGKSKDKSPADRLLLFERNDDYPTNNQLKALANVYRRPLLTFYLPQPPASDAALPDFRTIADAPVREVSPELAALIRRLRARQQQVREILVDDGAEPLALVGRFGQDTPAVDLVQDMRRELQFSIESQMRVANRHVLFSSLRERIEAVGFFVQLAGDLGSYHTQIEPEEFRGLALTDDIAPFVVINANDAQAAFAFTLIHEAAHIWLGAGGISNTFAFDRPQRGGARIEQLCNKVASEFLLPEDEFLASWRARDPQLALNVSVVALANAWKVSRAMIAHRLWTLGQIEDEDWFGLYRAYQEEWRRHREKLKEQKGGPGYHLLTKRKLGGALIQTVLNAVDSGTVTYTQASRILNVKVKNFDALREQVR